MELEDQQRFQVEVGRFAAEARLTCQRCYWNWEITAPLSLRDLIERADEHTEVCR